MVSDFALTSCINAARVTIGDSGKSQRLIKTLPRKGVRFVGTVREGDSPAGPEPPSVAPASRRPALALPDKPAPRVGYSLVTEPEALLPVQTQAANSETVIPSLAVLPFQNISGDPEQDYFADGIVEDIITALSRFRSFAVIARNSSFVYKGRAIDVRQIAMELASVTCSKEAFVAPVTSSDLGPTRRRLAGEHLWAKNSTALSRTFRCPGPGHRERRDGGRAAYPDGGGRASAPRAAAKQPTPSR